MVATELLPRDTRPRAQLCGVLIDRVDRAAAASMLERFIQDGRSHQVVTVNTDFASLADRDPGYRALLNSADLAIADGMPLVWLSRIGSSRLPERIAGIDLVEDCCRLAAVHGVPVYFLGARPGVAARAAEALQLRHPRMSIAGISSPPFAADTRQPDAEARADIKRAGRCVLLVAFGAPRQDRFIADLIQSADIPIAMGVGGTFDVIAGAIPRAPAWMQRAGLEWLWRMAQEPDRLWRRYLLRDLPFLLRMTIRALAARPEAA
jgi:N-acetylglucosaminyldiphosphoundecaprenol N-acetyl-beta-D-mannosaminyltransferase